MDGSNLRRFGLTGLLCLFVMACEGESRVVTEPCEPGDVMVRDCEVEGQERSRTCQGDGTWSEWGDCRQVVVTEDCTPGNVETSACQEECQERWRVCSADGSWGDWSDCEVTLLCTICSDDEIEMEACDDCIARNRNCGADNLWGPWSDCVEQTFSEVCDGYDNNCDGRVDEGRVCEGCRPAQTGETPPLATADIGGLVYNGEHLALMTRPDDSFPEEGGFALHHMDSNGALVGQSLEVSMPEEIDRISRLFDTILSSLLWTGSDYLLLTAYPHADSQMGFEPNVWRVRISTEGTVVDAAPVAAFSDDPSLAHNVETLMAVTNHESGRIGAVIEGYRWVPSQQVDMILSMVSMDPDGSNARDTVDLMTVANCDSLVGLWPLGSGFLVQCKDEDRVSIIMLTDQDGNSEGEPFGLPPEANEDYRVRIRDVLEQPDGNLALLISDDNSDRAAATVFVLTPAGDLVDLIDLPMINSQSMSVDAGLLDGGEVQIVAEWDDRLILARYNWSGQPEGEPVVLRDFSGERNCYMKSVTILPAPGSLTAVAWRDDQNLVYQARMNLVAPIDCDDRCESSSGCEPGTIETRSCGVETGACTMGIRQRECHERCIWEPWSPCNQATWPSTEDLETCFDEIDNDCDGFVDMDDTRCNVCDAPNSDHWICVYCNDVLPATVCECLSGEPIGVPCDCVLAGDPECDCTLDSELWYCHL